MPGAELPSSIVAQFRATSISRLGRIEEAWGSLTQRVGSADGESELFHDVHTLKGEARLVGFADVVLITQRLEDLFLVAKRRRYRVTEDVDVLVTMAIQFIRMLLRKKAGASQGGIDINGFLKQIDEVLVEWPRQSEVPDSSGTTSTRSGEPGKLSMAVRQRLGASATQIFLELLTSGRPRLRRAFDALADELAQLDAVSLLPLVRRHAAATKDLALELGKDVNVVVEGVDLKVSIEVLDAIHGALVHTLRNAADHGIESADAREAAGKPRRGNIAVRFHVDGDYIFVQVQDDGGGVDIESIRARAEKLGLLSPEDAQAAPETTLLDLTFAPGFSVRESASTVSGRGIGLDAVRAAIERQHGTIAIRSERGKGTSVHFQLAQSRRVLEVHRIPSTCERIAFAVPTSWTLRTEARHDAVDPVEVLGLRGADGDRVGPSSQIVLARDGEEHGLVIGGPVTRAAASRLCPTSPDDPMEVVAIEAERLLLLRPDAFFPALPRLVSEVG